MDEYRVLLILSVLYRKWACVRVLRLAPWIQSWALEDMFAGVPGQAAEDAWWLTSLIMESALCKGLWVSGAIVDIRRCFDQLSRVLMARILILAGMPRSIVDAYMRFHDKLQVYNSLAGGFGAPFHKRMAIHQG